MSTLAHAYLPPSGAFAWSKCAQWATMNARYPEQSSEESEEGDAAHWVGTELFAGRAHAVGAPTPNKRNVTEEMVEGAQLIIDTIAKLAPGLPMHVEETLPIRWIHPTACFGTPDYWGNTGHTKRIFIFDYKFGHRFVDEFWNPQGLSYLAGILELLYPEKTFPNDLEINFTIVQPRCYYKGAPVRTHTFKISEAVPYFAALRKAAEASLAPNPTATTNPACCYCPGRHACDALQLAAYSDAEFATARMPLELSPEAAGLELKMLSRALDRISARVDGLKEITLSNIRAGKRVPYYRAEMGFGRRSWNIPDTQIIAIGELFGADLRKDATITPTQAKKVIDEAVIMAYSETKATGMKLIEDNPADARKVFGNTPQ